MNNLRLKILITGSPKDHIRAQEIRAALSSPNVHLFFHSLLEVIPVIERAALIITPDTGTNHLASAVQTPTVVFFLGDGRPNGWGSRGVPHRTVQAKQGKDTSTIEVAELINATKELIGEIHSNPL